MARGFTLQALMKNNARSIKILKGVLIIFFVSIMIDSFILTISVLMVPGWNRLKRS